MFRKAISVLFTLGVSILITNGQAPIEVEILPSANVCVGRALHIKATVRNISRTPLAIDRNAVFYMLSYRFKADSRTTVNETAENSEDDLIVLNPKKRFVATKVINVNDSFFDREGQFKVAITYGRFGKAKFNGIDVWTGSVKSRYVGFNVASCTN